MGVCNCSMFCCTLLYVHSSIAIILMGKREPIALLNLSSWCLVMVERLFLAVPRGCLQFVIVVFPDHTHLLFLYDAHVHLPAFHALKAWCLAVMASSTTKLHIPIATHLLCCLQQTCLEFPPDFLNSSSCHKRLSGSLGCES